MRIFWPKIGRNQLVRAAHGTLPAESAINSLDSSGTLLVEPTLFWLVVCANIPDRFLTYSECIICGWCVEGREARRVQGARELPQLERAALLCGLQTFVAVGA